MIPRTVFIRAFYASGLEAEILYGYAAAERLMSLILKRRMFEEMAETETIPAFKEDLEAGAEAARRQIEEFWEEYEAQTGLISECES